MGFDLYGEDPLMRVIDENKYPLYNKYVGMEFKERQDIFDRAKKDIEGKYWDEYQLRETENPGVYFRSNCWWWRRLWSFTTHHCDDILTEEDAKGGNYNDMHLISEEKASAMAKILQERIDDGQAKAFEDEVKLDIESAEAKDKKDRTEEEEIALCYPFEVSHLRDFIVFCSESGGFTIG